jgi:RNA polymerase sigma-70 factor (ECF subfamily)
MAEQALMPPATAEALVNRSSLGTAGARALAGRVRDTDVVEVLDRVHSAEPPPSHSTEAAGYIVPAALPPRQDEGFTKETLDPLVRAVRQGGQHAIDDLLRVLRPVVARYCRARIGGRDLSYLSADDVAQEVCVAVLKALPDYQDRGGSFLYLVHAIAANKVADAYRTVSRDRSDPVPELPDRPLAGIDPEPLKSDLGARLGELFARLPLLQQEILTLRIMVGLSAAETAETLGISPGNVRITQYRALSRLREMTERETSDPEPKKGRPRWRKPRAGN